MAESHKVCADKNDSTDNVTGCGAEGMIQKWR